MKLLGLECGLSAKAAVEVLAVAAGVYHYRMFITAGWISQTLGQGNSEDISADLTVEALNALLLIAR